MPRFSGVWPDGSARARHRGWGVCYIRRCVSLVARCPPMYGRVWSVGGLVGGTERMGKAEEKEYTGWTGGCVGSCHIRFLAHFRSPLPVVGYSDAIVVVRKRASRCWRETEHLFYCILIQIRIGVYSSPEF